MAVIVLRSIVFNVLFYLNMLLLTLVAALTLPLPSWTTVEVSRIWGRTSLWLLRVICGIDVVWRGLEKIPPGPLLVAAKHQSAWDTFALLPLFALPCPVIKRELMWIPVFGLTMRKAGLIPVDRNAGREALADLVARVRAALATGRQIIIFPEGTRRPPRAEPDYKPGIAQLYAAAQVPCLPIALNSGVFWPRRAFLRYPGTIRVDILDPIQPGLPRGAFYKRLQQEMEAATVRLVTEGEQQRAAA